MIRLDHFILGVADLEKSVKDFESKTGVSPIKGGQHPSIGTHNALVSLEESYFELLAIDPTLGVVDHPIANELKTLKKSSFIGWAIQADHFDEVSAAVSKAHLSISKIFTGSRLTAEEKLLKYEYATIQGLDDFGVALPFVVKWINTAHPSATSPTGCRLSKVSLTHKKSPQLTALLKTLNLNIEVTEGATNRLQVEIDSPKGLIHFV